MGLPVQPPPPYRSLPGRLLFYLPPDGKPRPGRSARRLSRIWEKTARRAAWSPLILPSCDGKPRKEQRGGCSAYGGKTARRVARYLRSLHIERACVRPFSASSVDFPRRLCNGGEHSSPCASPEAPCGSARSPYRSLPGCLFAGTWCSGKVSPRGEARCSGASGSRILPENHSISASSDRMILLQSLVRPGLRRLAWFRSAQRAPVICSPALLRRPGEQITSARVAPLTLQGFSTTSADS